MKYIKTYEHNNIPRILGIATNSLYNIKEVLHSTNKYNIKTNIYISEPGGLNDSVVTFPEIYKDDVNDPNSKYIDFINNSWGHNFYTWYSIKYIEQTFIFIGTNLEEIDLSLAQNKYNL